MENLRVAPNELMIRVGWKKHLHMVISTSVTTIALISLSEFLFSSDCILKVRLFETIAEEKKKVGHYGFTDFRQSKLTHLLQLSFQSIKNCR